MMNLTKYIKIAASASVLSAMGASASVITTFNSGTTPFEITSVSGPGFSVGDIGSAPVVNRDQAHMIDGGAYYWKEPIETDKITFDDDPNTSWIEPPTSRGTWSKEDSDGVPGQVYTAPTFTNPGEAPGTWTASIEFTIPADAAVDCNYNLSGMIYADDSVIIALDGNQIADPDTVWYNDPIDMGDIALGNLAPGSTHSIDFVVTDTEGPTGLWTSGQVVCDCVPEPGAAALFGLGLGLLGLRRRR